MAAPLSDPVVFDTDVAVIGSGFGGSVTALRLAEKNYRVTVFEAGRRFADHEFASTSWIFDVSCGLRCSECSASNGSM